MKRLVARLTLSAVLLFVGVASGIFVTWLFDGCSTDLNAKDSPWP